MEKRMTIEQDEKETTITYPAPSESQKSTRRVWRGLWIVLLAAAVIFGYGIYIGVTSRSKANTALQRETLASTVPTVATVKPKVAAGAEEVVLPGNMQAFIDTP